MQDKSSWPEWMTEFYDTGEKLYHIIADNKPQDQEIIVSPAHLGDTIWLAVLSGEYRKQHQGKKLTYLIKEGQEEIIRMFQDIDAVVTLPETEMQALRYYMMIEQRYYENGIRYGHFPADVLSDHEYAVPQTPGDTMEHSYEIILDLPLDCAKSEMQIPEIDDMELEKMFGNAVLLAPGVFSMQGQPPDFWSELAAACKAHGHEVYTNWGGLEYDMEIPGTERLVSSLKELVLIADKFMMIVTSRSGICDLLAETKARQIDLYPAEASEKMKICDARDIRSGADVINCLYNDSSREELISRIMDRIERQ